jgi:hypothetical protein
MPYKTEIELQFLKRKTHRLLDLAVGHNEAAGKQPRVDGKRQFSGFDGKQGAANVSCLYR